MVREGVTLMKVPTRDVDPLRLRVVLLSVSVMAVSTVYRAGSDLGSDMTESLAFGLHQVLRSNHQV